ncbi:hypothetical protein OAH87_04835 [Marinomonas sp.]|nr:hypothetical protein [Marinomonas sp.]MDB4837775.1 hypothetical protein [Marinomonas sp.]
MQTDIEIYTLSCPKEKIISWLESVFTLKNKSTLSKLATKVTGDLNGHEIEVTILEKAAGKAFTSIWFDSDKTPWENDADCAKQAFSFLECEIRCNFEGWEEEKTDQDLDQWWRINEQGEGPFIWK